MSKIKKVEERLKLYKHYEVSIKNLEEDLELLKNMDGVGAIDYDKIGGGNTNRINSIVEDIGLSNIEQEHYIKHIIKRNKNLIKGIDRAIEALTEEEGTIIRNLYINNKTIKYISNMMCISERTLFRIRDQALEKMAVSIFGGKDN